MKTARRLSASISASSDLIAVVQLGLVCLLLAGSMVGHAESDLEPPELLALGVSTNHVDTATGPQTVEITAILRDQLSGFGLENQSRVAVALAPEEWVDQYLSAELAFVESVPSHDGVEARFRGAVTVFPGTVNGRWRADSFIATDVLGNRLDIAWRSSSAAAGQYAHLRPAIDVVGPEDRLTPRVADLSLSTNRLDLREPFPELALRVRLTDDLSGLPDQLSSSLLRFARPGHPEEGSYNLFGSGVRESGGPTDGWYLFRVSFPPFAAAATYRLSMFVFQDNAGNGSWVTPGELEARGLPVEIIVNNDPIVGSDSVPPELVSLRFATNSVDTSAAAQSVAVEIEARDNADGIVNGYLELFGPAGIHQVGVAVFGGGGPPPGAGQLQRLTGTAVFPAHCEAGLWRVARLELRDQNNNPLTLAANDLTAVGLPTTFLVNTSPRLQIVRADGRWLLWWRRVPGEFALERSSDLLVWTEVSSQAAGIEDFEVRVADGEGDDQLFRLRRL